MSPHAFRRGQVWLVTCVQPTSHLRTASAYEAGIISLLGNVDFKRKSLLKLQFTFPF